MRLRAVIGLVGLAGLPGLVVGVPRGRDLAAEAVAWFGVVDDVAEAAAELGPEPQPMDAAPTFDSLADSNCFVEAAAPNGTYNVTQCFWSNINEGTQTPPAPCITNESQLVFVNGQFSADQTFYNCLANVPDSPSMPTFYNGTRHGCSFLYTSITPVNLVGIDELSGTAQLQLQVNFLWYDFRYNMSLFWEHADAGASGVDLTRILTNDSVVMWLPEVTFPDASDITVQSETFSMLGWDQFYYSVSYDMTLVQPMFDFKAYPRDQQSLVIRYSTLNYDASELQMYPLGIYCSYLQDGSCSFQYNAIWTYAPSDNFCSVYYDQRKNSWMQAYTYYTITVERSPRGVILRLVVPLALLVLLSGLTFWIDRADRVNVTITLLLAISALYIVIIQTIPMVGYLTTVDEFVFVMYLLLCSVTLCHQVYCTISEKVDKWPLRLLYLRCIEICGRTLVVPYVIICFAETVKFDSTNRGAGQYIATAVIVSAAIFVREAMGMRKTFREAMNGVLGKINAQDTKLEDVSVVEAFAVNWYVFRKWSSSVMPISAYLAEHGSLVVDVVPSVSLRHAHTLKALLGHQVHTTPIAGRVEANGVELRAVANPLSGDFSTQRSDVCDSDDENQDRVRAPHRV